MPIALPREVREWLDSWGVPLRRSVSAFRAGWLRQHPIGGVSPADCPLSKTVVVGTDCSGPEAPLYALQAMGVTHRQAFSCDNAPGPQQFIRQNCTSSGPMFNDLLKRNPADVPPHNCYVAGFPCKAFSMLNCRSRLLKERTARPFAGVLRHMRECQPQVSVLENVLGIKRVLPQILARLRALGVYHIFVVQMDPRELGEPVRRPRMYFLMIRRDVALLGDDAETMRSMLDAMWDSVKVSHIAPLSSRLLPNNHPLVQTYLADRCQQMEAKRHAAAAAGRRGVSNRGVPKWRARHAEYCRAHRIGRPSPTVADAVLLTAEREREVWGIFSQLHSRGHQELAVDLSQCVSRAAARTDGTLPTVTPGSNLCVRSIGRTLLPVEKLLLHGFPVHRLNLEGLSDSVVSSLGGNTMHVKCVAAALAMALALTVGPLQPGARCSAIANVRRLPVLGTQCPRVQVGKRRPQACPRKQRPRAIPRKQGLQACPRAPAQGKQRRPLADRGKRANAAPVRGPAPVGRTPAITGVKRSLSDMFR